MGLVIFGIVLWTRHLQGDLDIADRKSWGLHVCEPVPGGQVPWPWCMRQSVPLPQHLRSTVVCNEGVLTFKDVNSASLRGSWRQNTG